MGKEYDLSQYADENPDFQIRFGIGLTDGSWQYCCWNIDDITLKGYEQQPYICGDINGDCQGPNMADLIYLLDYIFFGGPPPPVIGTANVDGNNGTNIIDVIYLVAYMFEGGPEPVCQ